MNWTLQCCYPPWSRNDSPTKWDAAGSRVQCQRSLSLVTQCAVWGVSCPLRWETGAADKKVQLERCH